MKFFLATVLTFLLSFISGLFLPWWSIAISAFLVALLIQQKLGLSYFSGFLGVFLMWAAVAFWLDFKNEGILSYKIAQIFPLGGSGILLLIISAFLGGLVGGFAALSGSSLRGRKKVST